MAHDEKVIDTLAFVGVLIAVLYLLSLGVGAIVSPDRTKRFLGTFASSPRVHFAELMLRMLAGASLVLRAPMMQLSEMISAFGWILIGTTIVLAFVPWQLHHRFAEWSVPRATRRMPLLGIASIAVGVLLCASLFIRAA